MAMGVFVQTNNGSRKAKSNPVGYVIEESGCWTWVGATSWDGYGRMSAGEPGSTSEVYAHRWFWCQKNGPIPDGKCLDHLCRNRACVNPDHLEAVTNRENLLRGEGFVAQLARKTHCKRGHELSDGNVYLARGPYGSFRVCKQCNILRCALRRKGLGK